MNNSPAVAPTPPPDQARLPKGTLWDRRIFIRSLKIGAVFLAINIGIILWMAPPKGTRFERGWRMEGIYKCCGDGSRYTSSTVNGVVIHCVSARYESPGTKAHCGFKRELNNQWVEIEQVMLPKIMSKSPNVSKLTSKGRVYYDYSDEELISRWYSSSRDVTIFWTANFMVIIYYLQLYFKSRKGNKK